MKYEDLSEYSKNFVDKCDRGEFTKTLPKGDFLIFKEKHGDRYFRFKSYDDLGKIGLKLLKERIVYFWKDELPNDLEITEEQVENLPEILKEEGKLKLKYYKDQVRSVAITNRFYELAHYAVKQNKPILAWFILKNRRDYQYEGFEFEFFEKV